MKFLKLLKYLASSGIDMIFGQWDLVFTTLCLEKTRRKFIIFNIICVGNLGCGHYYWVLKSIILPKF